MLAASAVGAVALVALHVFGVKDPSERTCGRDVGCIEGRYVALVDSDGPQSAMKAFAADYRRSPVVRAECHGLTHAIGHAAGARLRDVGASFRRGDRFCGSGYYHGVVEAIVSGPEREQALARPDEICRGLRSADRLDCTHGIGHGFMSLRGNDLRAALKLCDRLRRASDRGNCYAGAFMQNVMAEDDPRHPSRYLDPSRPLYPCDALGDRYRARCLERQILYALERYRGDFRTVFGLCSGLAGRYQPECFRKLGGAAAELNVSSQPSVPVQAQATAQICSLAPGATAQRRCAEGAVSHFVFYYDRTSEAKVFCRTLGALAGDCSRAAEELLQR